MIFNDDNKLDLKPDYVTFAEQWPLWPQMAITRHYIQIYIVCK